MKLSDFLSRFEVTEKEPAAEQEPAITVEPEAAEPEQPAPVPAPEYLTREQIQGMLESELAKFYESFKAAKRSEPVEQVPGQESFEEFLKKHYES